MGCCYGVGGLEPLMMGSNPPVPLTTIFLYFWWGFNGSAWWPPQNLRGSNVPGKGGGTKSSERFPCLRLPPSRCKLAFLLVLDSYQNRRTHFCWVQCDGVFGTSSIWLTFDGKIWRNKNDSNCTNDLQTRSTVWYHEKSTIHYSHCR